VIAAAIYWELNVQYFIQFVQIWHFYCTMSRGLLISRHSV